MNINSLTIGKRIALGFAIILAILLILGATALVKLPSGTEALMGLVVDAV